MAAIPDDAHFSAQNRDSKKNLSSKLKYSMVPSGLRAFVKKVGARHPTFSWSAKRKLETNGSFGVQRVTTDW